MEGAWEQSSDSVQINKKFVFHLVDEGRLLLQDIIPSPAPENSSPRTFKLMARFASKDESESHIVGGCDEHSRDSRVFEDGGDSMCMTEMDE